MKYTITLIVPSIIWVILGRIFFGLLAILNGEEPGWFSFDPYNPVYGNGSAWFLLALFYVKIIQWICCHWFSSRYLMYMEILMSCILGYIGINHQMPMQIDEAFAALPFYVSGKYLYPYLRKMIYNNWVLLMGTLCYSLLYFKVVRFWLNPSVNGLYNQVYLTSVLCTILSFALFLRISFIIATPPLRLSARVFQILRTFLIDFGKNTLGILLIHVPLCHVSAAILHRVYERGSMEWIVLFVVAYFLIVIISYKTVQIINKRWPIVNSKKKK